MSRYENNVTTWVDISSRPPFWLRNYGHVTVLMAPKSGRLWEFSRYWRVEGFSDDRRPKLRPLVNFLIHPLGQVPCVRRWAGRELIVLSSQRGRKLRARETNKEDGYRASFGGPFIRMFPLTFIITQGLPRCCLSTKYLGPLAQVKVIGLFSR